MNEAQAAALRAQPPEHEIGKLPRVTCPDCRKASGKVCSKHAKSKCPGCNNFITGAHIHLDYFGHAETTDRLLSVDPEWSWEPVGWDELGSPLIAKQGGNLVMWGRLTVCGVTRLGVGTAEASKDDAHKELIGDFLRNAAMRFGVALDLWRKSERHEVEQEPEPDADELPCRVCGEMVPGAASDKEPMRTHLVDVHQYTRNDDGTVVKPKPAVGAAPESDGGSTVPPPTEGGTSDPSAENPPAPASLSDDATPQSDVYDDRTIPCDPVVVDRLVTRVNLLPPDLAADCMAALVLSGIDLDALMAWEFQEATNLIQDFEERQTDPAARARAMAARVHSGDAA